MGPFPNDRIVGWALVGAAAIVIALNAGSGAAGSRDTYKYRYRDQRRRILHSGITNDLTRRESELRNKYGPGAIEQVGRRTTRKAAKLWERGKPSAGRAGP